MFDLIGETLRRLRKEKGKTLEQLGAEAGLGRGQLSRIENARQEATLSTLAKILQSQGVGRREFFRRYDLVEAEALALQGPAGAPPQAVEGPAVEEGEGRWAEDIRQALGRVGSFVQSTFSQSRPIAQGAVELGEVVVLFQVVPKALHRPDPVPEGGRPEGGEAPAPSTSQRRKKKR
ncbi:MAG TPA: helix-turn-helix transcriptional regulator [Thermoanaerobaculia bacterium]|nr:helix-turn-helix transcriptional regulator [Thermoanaerobaculia bacterium]